MTQGCPFTDPLAHRAPQTYIKNPETSKDPKTFRVGVLQLRREPALAHRLLQRGAQAADVGRQAPLRLGRARRALLRGARAHARRRQHRLRRLQAGYPVNPKDPEAQKPSYPKY